MNFKMQSLTPEQYHARIKQYYNDFKILTERRKLEEKERKEEYAPPKPEYNYRLTAKGSLTITFRKSARAEKWLTKDEINDIAIKLSLPQNTVWQYVNKKSIEIRKGDHNGKSKEGCKS